MAKPKKRKQLKIEIGIYNNIIEIFHKDPEVFFNQFGFSPVKIALTKICELRLGLDH